MKNKKLSPPVMFWITFAIAAAGSIASVVINNNGDFTGRFTVALVIYVLFFVFAIFADVEEIKKTHKHAESFDFITNKENRENSKVITPDWFVICDDEKMYKYNTADVDIWIMKDGKYQPFQRVKPVEVFDLTEAGKAEAAKAKLNSVE